MNKINTYTFKATVEYIETPEGEPIELVFESTILKRLTPQEMLESISHYIGEKFPSEYDYKVTSIKLYDDNKLYMTMHLGDSDE